MAAPRPADLLVVTVTVVIGPDVRVTSGVQARRNQCRGPGLHTAAARSGPHGGTAADRHDE